MSSRELASATRATPGIGPAVPGPACIPAITSIDPSRATVGTTVVTSGEHFQPTTTSCGPQDLPPVVQFLEGHPSGPLTAAVSDFNDKKITARVPSESESSISAADHDRTDGPTELAAAPRSVRPLIPSGLPEVDSISPTSGQVGTTVRIMGRNFMGPATVTFNGVQSTKVMVQSETLITADVPAGATIGPVVVSTAFGTALNQPIFIVIVPPAIFSFDPDSGCPGTLVTIRGRGLSSATSVAFNGTPADFGPTGPFLDDSALAARVPSGASTGPITVTNPLGTATSAAKFTIIRAPSIMSFAPTSGPVGTMVTLTGSGFTGTTDVKFNGAKATKFMVIQDGSLTATVPNDAKTGRITVTNCAGTATSTTDFQVIASPVVNSFSPRSGTPGTTVKLFGTHLGPVTHVKFTHKSPPPKFIDATITGRVGNTEIDVKVPEMVGTGPIRVVSPGGSFTTTDNFVATAPGGPAITAFTPDRGPAETRVTITGSGLTGTREVRFGGVTATGLTVDSDTQVRASVPRGLSPGPVGIRVITNNGATRSPTDFTVTANGPGRPTIDAINPVSGPVGTNVTLTGKHLSGIASVVVGGQAAQALLGSDTQVVVTIPNGLPAGSVAIQLRDATGTVVASVNFTVLAPTTKAPTITDLSPASAGAGAAVTVTGTNLATATQVIVGAVPASFRVLSDTQVTFTVPTGVPPGPAQVEAVTPAGTAVSPVPLTVLGGGPTPVVLAQITPGSGPAGTDVTLSGSGFRQVTSVQFGSAIATYTVQSDTVIATREPAGVPLGPTTVTVTTADLRQASTRFTVTAPDPGSLPVIDGFSPASGRPGTTVTITGQHFTGTQSVSFGGAIASFQVVSDTTLTARVPFDAGTPGQRVQVIITNAAGTTVGRGFFLVTG